MSERPCRYKSTNLVTHLLPSLLLPVSQIYSIHAQLVTLKVIQPILETFVSHLHPDIILDSIFIFDPSNKCESKSSFSHDLLHTSFTSNSF